MIKTRSDSTLVWLTNAAAVGAGPGSTTIVNSAGWVVNIGNSANWVVAVGSTSIVNSAGWIVAVSNTSPLVSIQNSAGWIVNQANTGGSFTVLNSGGLYAMQSGAWSVSSTILNSAGWLIGISNSGGLYAMQSGLWTISSTILNSGGWTVKIANTGGTVLSQTLANTAGWIVSVANTGGNTNITNSAGWAVSSTILNSGGWVVSASSTILNSAGWIVNVSNTGGSVISSYNTNLIYDNTTATNIQFATITVGNSGNNQIVAAVSGKRIRVISTFLISNGTGTAFWQSDSTSAVNLTGPQFLAANVGYVLGFNPNGWFQTATSTLLNLSCSTVNSMGGCLSYIQTS